MRIRPFFWFLLLTSCMCIVLFALIYQPHTPSFLKVKVTPLQLIANSPASLQLSITDGAGTPIDQVQVIPKAWMTNMVMETSNSQVTALGNGEYRVSMHLYMEGPWAIKIQTHAAGFAPQQDTLFVQVT